MKKFTHKASVRNMYRNRQSFGVKNDGTVKLINDLPKPEISDEELLQELTEIAAELFVWIPKIGF